MNGLRAELLAQRLVVATMISEVRTASIATMLKASGLTSFIIDMEHGAYDWSDVAGIVALGRAHGLAPVVRVPECAKAHVQRALDAGAQGIVVPMVNSASEAEHAVRLVRYPARGDRGVALRRAHSDFTSPADPIAYMTAHDNSIAVMVQIETTEAVANAAQIAAVDGIDALFLGPWDLSVSRGVPGAVWTPEAREIYARVLDVARSHDVAGAIHVTSAEQAAALAKDGFSYISTGNEAAVLIDGYRHVLDVVHGRT